MRVTSSFESHHSFIKLVLSTKKQLSSITEAKSCFPIPVSYTHLDVYKRQPCDFELCHRLSEDKHIVEIAYNRIKNKVEDHSCTCLLYTSVCRKIAQKLDGFEGFHFHQLRHTYTSNLLANGAAPKDVQELLGHSDVSTTMNVYAHSTRKAKRDSARLLDKVAGND